ncbi:MAG: FtsX-like permease family protein [Bdellovibrionales bacterium]
MIFQLAWRNLIRNRRRSLLTGGLIVFVYVLLSGFKTLSDGVYDRIIDGFILEHTGHVQVYAEDFLDDPKIYKAIPLDDAKIQRILRSHTTSPRILGSALASHKSYSFGAEVVGIDPQREIQVTTLNKRVTQGIYFSEASPQNAALVGGLLAQRLHLKVGDSFVMIGQAADGSVANDRFTVIGINQSSTPSKDDMRVYISLSSAQDFYFLESRANKLVFHVNGENSTIEEVRLQLAGMLPKSMSAVDWKVVEKDFYRAMQADKAGDNIARYIFVFVAALGVLNTLLMSLLERQREFGVLLAIGTRPSYLSVLIFIETTILILVSCCIGASIALITNWYLSEVGFALETPFEYGGFEFSSMRGKLDFAAFWFPFLVILISSWIVSILPAMRVRSISPLETMRGI